LAVVSPSFHVLKVFVIDNNNGVVSELFYDDSKGWSSIEAIGTARAAITSPLTAVVRGETVFVFWFTPDSVLQFSVSGSVWSAPVNLTGRLSSLPSSLTGALSVNPDVIQIFYSEGQALEEVQRVDGKWDNLNITGEVPKLGMSNGPIAAVGWNGSTSTRIYYVVDSKVQELAPGSSGEWEDTADWDTSLLSY
jgi:hypothetical protein